MPRPGFDTLKSHVGLLVASAVLLGLAFPRPGWWPLAHVALVPMALLAVRAASGWRLAWTSYLVALAWWLFMARWLIGVTVGGWFGLEAYMAVYTPLSLLLLRWLYRRWHAPLVLLLPMVWVSLEYTRCTFLQGGFAWFALGHSQAPYMPEQGVGRLMQIADLFGQHGVSFLVAMTNGLVIDLLINPLVRPTPPRRIGRSVLLSASLWAAATVAALAYGYERAQPRHDPPGLRVAVIQTNVPQDNKEHGSAEQTERDWMRMVDLTLAASRATPKPDLIVWPETMVPAALNPEALAYYKTAASGARGSEVFHEQVQQLARGLGVDMLVGAAAESDWGPHTIDGAVYDLPSFRANSAYLYRRDGSQDPLRYDKIHRVPFGEYIPWIDGTPWLKRLFMRYLSPYGDYDYTIQQGKSYTVFAVLPRGDTGRGAVKIATPICFEDVIVEAPRRMMAQDGGGGKNVDLLVNVTNDGWFADTDQGLQQLQIAVLRCVENRVPMARSVNTGVSGFIDSNGVVGQVVRIGDRVQSVEGWAVADTTIDPRMTLFTRIGPKPLWGLMALTALLAIGGIFRPETR